MKNDQEQHIGRSLCPTVLSVFTNSYILHNFDGPGQQMTCYGYVDELDVCIRSVNVAPVRVACAASPISNVWRCLGNFE